MAQHFDYDNVAEGKEDEKTTPQSLIDHLLRIVNRNHDE